MIWVGALGGTRTTLLPTKKQADIVSIQKGSSLYRAPFLGGDVSFVERRVQVLESGFNFGV